MMIKALVNWCCQTHTISLITPSENPFENTKCFEININSQQSQTGIEGEQEVHINVEEQLQCTLDDPETRMHKINHFRWKTWITN